MRVRWVSGRGDPSASGSPARRSHPQHLCPATLPSIPPCRDKAAAHADLSDQHHLVQEERRGLAADKAALEAALAEARQRAQQAETLGAGLQAECGAGRQLAAALQEEADELRGELQQARCWGVPWEGAGDRG